MERNTVMAFEEKQLQGLVQSIWGTMLDLPAWPNPRPAPRSEQVPFLTSFVSVHGDWEGAVLVDWSPELARLAAGRMFGVSPAAVTAEQIHDALGELTNVIGGNVKGLLPGSSHLSLPTVVDSTQSPWPPRERVSLVHSNFECQNLPFRVTVVRKLP